jgi:hypothetical protein
VKHRQIGGGDQGGDVRGIRVRHLRPDLAELLHLPVAPQPLVDLGRGAGRPRAHLGEHHVAGPLQGEHLLGAAQAAQGRADRLEQLGRQLASPHTLERPGEEREQARAGQRQDPEALQPTRIGGDFVLRELRGQLVRKRHQGATAHVTQQGRVVRQLVR